MNGMRQKGQTTAGGPGMQHAHPSIDERSLTQVLHREYGLRVERLTFLKKAWVANCYAADCAGRARYFCKFYGDARQAHAYARDVDFYLSLTYALATEQILPTIACPVQTLNKSFSVCFDGHLLILFHWIEGQTLGFGPLPDDVLPRLGTLVGTLHASTPQITTLKPPHEQFDIPFYADLVNGLDTLHHITPTHTFGQQELSRLLLPRRDAILRLLDRLQDLAARTKARDREQVICHTDLHGGNLIRDDRGTLYILDWEGTVLAPPEHDLIFCAWDDRFWDLFLPSYQRAFGPTHLDSTAFGFYLTRRNLEDLADFIVRILYEQNGDEQDRVDLQGMVDDCIADWPALEQASAAIETRLQQVAQRS
jgi:spectinomycin phosphotransferase